MPRRTKTEAEETRQRLLDAAIKVFRSHGVSRSTLDEIAQEAGATRGAIAWHFKDKAGLLTALVNRTGAPIEAEIAKRVAEDSDLPLTIVVVVITEPLRLLASSQEVRDVVSITFNMMENTPELAAFRESSAISQSSIAAKFSQALIDASRVHNIKLKVPPSIASHTLTALLYGLMRTWIVNPDAFDLLRTSRAAVMLQLAGLGFDDATLAMYGVDRSLQSRKMRSRSSSGAI